MNIGTPDELDSAASRLNVLLAARGLATLDAVLCDRFHDYLALLLRWNARVSLTSVRDINGILSRHFVESIACAQALPAGIRTLLDFGSGAGFPGIPIALCRPEMAVTLAESQGKKAAFLREAIRVLGISIGVSNQRAEKLDVRFDCVVLRAVDRMKEAVQGAARLIAPRGWLALMTTVGECERLKAAAGCDFRWREPVPLPGGQNRVLVLGSRADNL